MNKQHSRHKMEQRAAGRPKHFDEAALRDVWVYVQAWAIIMDMPISKICHSKNASFGWYAANVPDAKQGLRLEHMVEDETLRRRYYEAVRFLKEETKPYRELREKGIVSSAFGEISPVEGWWRQLRDEAVARIKKSAS